MTPPRALSRRVVPLVSGILAALALLAVPAAHAGTYTVSTCKSPNGLAASTSNWTYSVYAASIDHWSDSCPRGGVRLMMDPGVTHPKDDNMEALWTAPPDTLIVGYTMWRSVSLTAGTHYFATVVERTAGAETRVGPSCRGDSCSGLGTPSNPLAASNRFDRVPPQPVNQIGIYASCGYFTSSDPDCPSASPALDFVMHRADITLSDDVAPTWAAPPSGSLLDGTRPLSGVQQVAYQAADKGGGVASVSIEVDGQVVATDPVTDTAGTCQTPYVSAVPCPLAAGGSLAFDTTKVPDGGHQVRILLTDAAGNVTPSDAYTITTNNAPPDTSCVPSPLAPAGTAALTARSQRIAKSPRSRPQALTSLTVAYGTKTRVTGTLKGTGGAPVANASLCLVWRPGGTGGTYQTLARTTTASDGTYSVTVPTGSSRDVVAIYRTGGGAVIGSTSLKVEPQVAAKARHSHLHNGQVLQISGHVSGGPFPHRGVVLNLQAIRDGRWQGFSDPFRTDAKGRFTFRYRFTRTLGVQRYRLRIRSVAQAGYPYVTGFSRKLTIKVLGASS